MADKQRGKRRLLTTIPFTASTKAPIEVPTAGRFIKRLVLVVTFTLTISALTVPGVLHADGAPNLIDQISLRVDGKTYKQGAGAAFFRTAQRFDQCAGFARGLYSPGVGVYDCAFEIPLLFEDPLSAFPLETLIDGRKISHMNLDVTWGSTASLVVGNTSTLALSNVACELYVEDTAPFPTSQPFWVFRELEHFAVGVGTSPNTPLAIPLPAGTALRSLLLRTVDGSNLNDAILNTLTLKIDGEETPYDSLDDQYLKQAAVHEFAGYTPSAGTYWLEAAERGQVLKTALGVERIQNLDLAMNTTVGAGATSVIAHTHEHAPPAVV